MLRNMLSVGGFTAMSRVLGFLRDVITASYIGATMVSDAWYAAFRFPNLGRRVFGEGAFNAAFVPLFGREWNDNGEETATQFANQAFSWLLFILGGSMLVIVPLMRWFILPLTFGFLRPAEFETTKLWMQSELSWVWLWEMLQHPGGTVKFELAVAYSRVMFSYLICMALAAHLSGVLNTLKVFAVPAFAPVLMNIILLLGLLGIIPGLHYTEDKQASGWVLSWCVFAAGFAQVALVYFACLKRGLKIRPVIPRRSPGMKRLLDLMVPGIISASVQQVNLIVGSLIASMQDKAVSYLYYSDRIYQLPLGMIGIAFGVVLLPEITRRLHRNDRDGARRSLSRGIEFSMLITLPAMVAMVAIPQELITVIFQRNQFTPESAMATAAALSAFALGLPGYVLIRVLQPGYFAQENTKAPMRMAIITVGVNIVASLILFPLFRHVGIALATAIAAWVNVAMLWRGLGDFLHMPAATWSKLARMLLASLLMGALVWTLAWLLRGWFAGGELPRIAALAIVIGAGMSAYGALVIALRATSLAEMKGALGKK